MMTKKGWRTKEKTVGSSIKFDADEMGFDNAGGQKSINGLIGIRTGLPLPSGWEVVTQLIVYFIVEDYTNYWIHRMLHGKWGYEKIHKVHHEYTAPIGFAAPYAHWAEVLILGIPSFLGPAIAPGHMITFWLWIAFRQIEAIETHSGYDFPWTPTKYIPFYGGAEHHDYHHYVGGQSQRLSLSEKAPCQAERRIEQQWPTNWTQNGIATSFFNLWMAVSGRYEAPSTESDDLALVIQ
ncbi:hypothetical protein KSS87_014052 [Heliosperma pusillum]|nr:hypothetical protein KSS87_014052 [Heliosperma pusillum]